MGSINQEIMSISILVSSKIHTSYISCIAGIITEYYTEQSLLSFNLPLMNAKRNCTVPHRYVCNIGVLGWQLHITYIACLSIIIYRGN